MSSEPEIKICLVLLVGLPGAGKTTFCKNLVAEFAKSDFAVFHVCYDRFVDLEEQAKLVQNDESQKWKDKRKEIIFQVENFLQTITEKKEFSEAEKYFLLKVDKDVEDLRNISASPLIFLLDDNFYYNSMRYEYYQLARKFKTGFCQFLIEVSTADALKRNGLRVAAEQVPEDVITKMAGKLEQPNPLMNSWERFSFTLKNVQNDFPVEMCQNIIQLALANPAQPVPEVNEEERDKSRAICTASVVHQADKILRKKLNATILDAKRSSESNDQAKLREFSQRLNGARVELLEDLKTGFTKLPAGVVGAVEAKAPNATESLELIVSEMFELKLNELPKS